MRALSENLRRRSIRLPAYDYSQAGAYFVTICTLNRECLFGKVMDGKVQLNPFGCVVEEEWLKTAELRPCIELGTSVVMPNHFHGIIVINDECRGTARRAPTVSRFGKPVAGALSTVIRSFKSAVTKRINDLRRTPGNVVWQRNYYEHIIRNEDDWKKIHDYIVYNPEKWMVDAENPDRINRKLGL
ncbi:MAG TPA: transposase [Verrucomicrobiae bacterium]|nr:transposase [Verrucomicrobiae bacterium]